MTNLAQMSKSKRKTEYRNAGKAYSRVMKTAAKDKTPSNVQEDTRKKFIFSYEEILRYFQNDTEVTLDDVSSDFRKLMTDALPYLFSTANGRALSPQEQQGPSPSVEGAIRRGLQQSGESPREEPDGEESGQKVTAAQKSGLMDIARWLLRNMDKHGAAGDSKSAWVRGYVLEQPPRVKLLAYYMVENGASSLTGEALQSAIAQSQSPGYVPNLEKFKDKMISSKFLAWRRVTGGTFKWGDLAEAMRFAVSVSGELSKFGMEQSEVTGRAGADAASSAASGSGGAQAAQALLIRHKAFLALRDQLLKRLEAKEKAGARWTPEQEQGLKQMMAEYLRNAQLLLSDVESAEAGSHSAQEGKISQANTVQEGKDTVEGNMADFLGVLKEFLKEVPSTDRLGEAGDWLSNIAAINAFTAVFTNVIELAVKGSYTTSAAKLEKTMDLFSNLWKVVKGGVSVYEKITKVEGVLPPGVDTVFTGILDFGSGMTSVTTAGVQKSHLTSSQEKIQANQSLSDRDKELTAKAAALRRRQLNTKQATGTMKMLSGGLQIAAGVLEMTGVAAPVGAILQAVALGITLVSSIFSYYRKKKNIRNTIDDYIQMDQIYPIVVTEITKLAIRQHEIEGKPVTAPSEDELKYHIRLEAAAQMGCYSLSDFYNYITRVYATLIYEKAMLKDDGSPMTFDSKGKPELSETNKQYIEMLAAYGLKPDFKKKRPTVDTIQKAMAN